MSLTLSNQMDSLFRNGIKVIKMHEQYIIQEWDKVLTRLKKTGGKSAINMESTIHFFTEYLFKQEEQDANKTIDNNQHRPTPQFAISFESNQFIITMLENAVHKVVRARTEHSYQDHQGIQYVFSSISEHIQAPYHHYFAIDTFLKNLVSSNQLPIEWSAIVMKVDGIFIIEKWFNNMNQDLLLGTDALKANSIYGLSELLLDQMPYEDRSKYTVLPIPHNDITLLVCMEHKSSSHVIPFITYALQIFQNGKETLKVTKEEQQWKDSIIMFNEMIIRSQTFNEAVENITGGFVNYLPFERCALFSYSVNDQMGFGLFGQRLDNNVIQNITEDISNLPLIQNSLQVLQLFGKNMNYIQPLYMEDASLGFPDQYVQQFDLRSVVVAPIYTSSSGKLLGAAILDQGPGKYFKLSQETFSTLIKFGKSAGEILAKYHSEQFEPQVAAHLSPRELEVLQLMAEGASTNEAASDLNLSEYTVRDYVSAIMQKMEARNRTEAVARAIRDGMI